MKITLENTSKVVTLVVDGKEVPARIWEGITSSGARCHAYITRIACDSDDDGTNEAFEAELQSVREPSEEIRTIPLRMII